MFSIGKCWAIRKRFWWLLKSIFNSNPPNYAEEGRIASHSPKLKNIDVLWNITALLHPSNRHKRAHHTHRMERLGFLPARKNNFGKWEGSFLDLIFFNSCHISANILNDFLIWDLVYEDQIKSFRFDSIEAAHTHWIYQPWNGPFNRRLATWQPFTASIDFGTKKFGYGTLWSVFCFGSIQNRLVFKRRQQWNGGKLEKTHHQTFT